MQWRRRWCCYGVSKAGGRAVEVAALILANLEVIAEDLEGGAIVVLDDDRLRIRRLPLRPD